jgi:hypothetical protein
MQVGTSALLPRIDGGVVSPSLKYVFAMSLRAKLILTPQRVRYYWAARCGCLDFATVSERRYIYLG